MFKSIQSFINSGEKRTRIAKLNILGSILIKGVSIIVQLLLVPITLGYLSEELYGVWITLSSIIIWISFFDIGLTLGLKNKLAEALAVGDRALGKKLVSTTYATLICIFIPLCILGQFIIPQIDWCNILNIPIIYKNDVVNALKVIFGCVCIQMIFNAISSILAAYQKVALSSIFTPIGNLISLIVIFFLTKYTQPSLINLVLSVSYIPLLVLIIGNIIYFSGQLKDVRPSFKSISFPLVRQIFSLGIGFFFLSVQYVVIFQSTNLLISYISSPIYVTQYSIAYRYLSVTLMLFGLVVNPFWPAFTDAYTKKDFNWMNRMYHKLIRFYYLSVFGLIIMLLLSPLAYKIWIGDATTIPFSMTLVVSIYLGINTWNTFQSNLLNGIGAIKTQVVVSLFGLILYIPLAIILGKQYGAIGIVIAISIISFIYSIVYTRELRKILNYKYF
ncbi:MATE family efflux transporter [Duncaniella sp.]|uniref:lipopolysaccharide biosynthesis protein n=4 Tax=Duncaniella TaxID=2518495 RepID=UPI00257F1979|nr:MATE family efflux transporter [Duncaniella sp.]